jgi:hypothetical protein
MTLETNEPSKNNFDFRLGVPQKLTMPLPKFIGEPGVAIPARFADFEKMLVWEPRQVTVYEVEGHGAKVIVPTEYDALLKTVEYRNSLAPADVPGLLAQLPDPALITEIRLFNERNPEDYWHEHHTGIDSGATATEFGVVSFFYSMRGPADANLEIRHEWAHIHYYEMHWTRKAEVDAAINVEREGFHLREQSKTSNMENFAVTFGEGILSEETEIFEKVVHEAPVRSLVAAYALLRSLNSHRRSCLYDLWWERFEYIIESARDAARAKLVEIAKGSDDSKQLADAAKLLAIYGESSDLTDIDRPLRFALAQHPNVDNRMLVKIANAPKIEMLQIEGIQNLEPETFSLFANSGMTRLVAYKTYLRDIAVKVCLSGNLH